MFLADLSAGGCCQRVKASALAQPARAGARPACATHVKGAITWAPVQLFQRKEGSGNSLDGVVEAIELRTSQAQEILDSAGTRSKLFLEGQLQHDHERSLEIRGYIHGLSGATLAR